MPSAVIPLPDLSATEALAHKLAPLLKKGDFLSLEGGLGTGKTALARALLQALGVKGTIESPTFTMVQRYETPDFPANHFDLFRLKKVNELDDIGWNGALADGLAIVEWSERAESRMPPDRLSLTFSLSGTYERTCTLKGYGKWSKHEELVHIARDAEVRGFAAESGWGKVTVECIQAKRHRRFYRLTRDDGKTAIMLDADEDQKTLQFVTLASILKDLDLSSPEIYATRPRRGLALMEDFGDANVGRLIDEQMQAYPYFQRAVHVLVRIHSQFEAIKIKYLEVPTFTSALFAARVDKFLDHYFPYVLKREATAEERSNFHDAWRRTLEPVDHLPQTLMLRDFTPDNVMDLPDRKGWRSLGLLDFQDAGLGPIAYDLASFCDVVRRDGGDDYLSMMITQYHERAKPACTLEVLQRGCTVLAAQRHTRALGLIAGRPDKMDYLPRAQNYLGRLLREEAMKPVRSWFMDVGLPLP
jgi:N-acetylmuramate 1-kinase